MQKKAVVIGSGFGGLAAAIRLAARGVSVTLLEKQDQPGGRAIVFKEHGFTFDAGPTVVTVPQCIAELFTLANRKMEDYVELIPVDPYYRIFWDDGQIFNYSGDRGAVLREIERFSTKDVIGYQKFYRYAHEVYKHGYERLADHPFLKVSDMLRVAPQLLRLGAYRSVYEVVSKYIQHPKMRQVLSFNSLLIGGNPFKASAIYSLIHPLEQEFGIWFPRGGMHALVQGLVTLFKELGGTIALGSEVDSIDVKDGKVAAVTMKNGETLPADFVVSNADVMHTYRYMLRKTDHGRRMAYSLGQKKFSMSLVVVYFGTNKDFPNLAHHNVIFGPRYRGLIEDIFEHGKIPDDFSLYVHAPSKTDASLAPEGHHSFYALCPVPHLGRAAVDWSRFGGPFSDKILTYLDNHFMPGLRQSIVVSKTMTPKDFETMQNSHLGSVFSLEPTLTQSAWFRVHNRDPKISGLYFVGAGTHPGAGIPGVINSAKATDRIIASDVLGEVLAKEPRSLRNPQEVRV